MLGILNPWVLLGIGAAIAGSSALGYIQGRSAGGDAVQVKFDRAIQEAQAAQNRKLILPAEATASLSAVAEQRRTEDAKRIEVLDASLVSATERLSERPPRPTGQQPVSPTKSAGAPSNGGCTGAGLYRDDGLFLRRKADLWQRIRIQRDNCYAQYEAAQGEIERLRGATR